MPSPYNPSPISTPVDQSTSSNPASLARLTSLSTQALTSLLERQRLASFSRTPTSPTQNVSRSGVDPTPQTTRNLKLLREGILEYERQQTEGDASLSRLASRTRRRQIEDETRELRDQFRRMRSMLARPDDIVEELEELPPSPPPSPPPERELEGTMKGLSSYMPYKDDPDALERGPDDGEAFQMNEQMMMDQDNRLDHLSESINRQRDISLGINSELEVHTGLLEGLDTDLDRTGDRLSGARRQLDRFSRGMKGNGASIFIVLLITILLLLIVILKT